ASASYLARRAAQKEKVRILYRRALKDTLNWAVHRHLFYNDADALRERFEANRNVVCSPFTPTPSFFFLVPFHVIYVLN
ncbi:NADH dehydrogenase [ubiquinone] 1 beta subcomplex subunit 9, partial [Phtheirospermum japonicum]